MAKYVDGTGALKGGGGITSTYGGVSNVNGRLAPRVEMVLSKTARGAGSLFVTMTPAQAVDLANQLVASAEKADDTLEKIRKARTT